MEVALASPTNPSASEQVMHKNRLHEYAQRSALPLPVYQTVNEGFPHAPQFRSTVMVDGVTFTSSQTFFHRKEAEQNVAKMALEGIYIKIKQEGCSLIRADATFCKSILHEYAVKVNLNKPTYTCSGPHGPLPMFTSSVLLDGKTYEGIAGRNKKQAEQFAARAAIESILGNSNSPTRTPMSQIIKSKAKLYAVGHQVNVSNISPRTNGGNIENLFGNSAPVVKDEQGALINEMPPVAVHAVGCAHGQHPAEEKLKGELVCELRHSHVGNGTTLQHQPEAAPPSQQVMSSSHTVSESCRCQEENATSSVGPSGFSNESRATPPSRKRKHSNVGKGDNESNSSDRKQ